MLLVAVNDGAMLLIMAGGAASAVDVDSALYLLAPAVIALALLAIANSWKLTLVGSEPAGEI